jgi:hypothetical protein
VVSLDSIAWAMRSLAVACTLVALDAGAREIFIDDSSGELMRFSLIVKPERVRHAGNDYLSIRIQSTELRRSAYSATGWDAANIRDAGLAFLPVTVRCHDVAMTHQGKTTRPDPASMCFDTRRLDHPAAIPLFVMFRYPGPGDVRVTLPITVQRPDPPIQRTLQPTPAILLPRVDESLLGEREMIVRFRLD